MTDELVHHEVDDGVATITLDSPHNRNALSRQLVTQLFDALDRAEQDPEVHVVLIRSADRVFCSGADLSEAAEGGMEEGAQALVALQRRILSHRSPVVTRLAGPVRAGGLGIVAASDIVLCSDDVTFAFTEVRLALSPAVISLTVLPRLTSRGAAESFLTGRKFDAAEAAQMGLVDQDRRSRGARRRGRPGLRRPGQGPPAGVARDQGAAGCAGAGQPGRKG